MKKFTLSIIKKSIITKIRSQHQTKIRSNDFGCTAVAIAAMILVSATTMAQLPTGDTLKACDPDAPGVNVIIGTEKFDYLRGTPGDDVILALGGNDIIIGGGGNDCIDGGGEFQ